MVKSPPPPPPLQISSEQALAAFESRLEQDLLVAHQRNIEQHIEQPLTTYKSVATQLLHLYCLYL